jgi:hypothetical protein
MHREKSKLGEGRVETDCREGGREGGREGLEEGETCCSAALDETEKDEGFRRCQCYKHDFSVSQTHGELPAT